MLQMRPYQRDSTENRKYRLQEKQGPHILKASNVNGCQTRILSGLKIMVTLAKGSAWIFDRVRVGPPSGSDHIFWLANINERVNTFFGLDQ